MLHLLLADLPIKRLGDRAVRWPLSRPRALAGQAVRVVYADANGMRPVLRALCAMDCEVELLDIETPAWALVHYDKSPVRQALRRHGLPVLDPISIHMSRAAALWLIGELTGSNQTLAGAAA